MSHRSRRPSSAGSLPGSLGDSLNQLIQARGVAKPQADSELKEAWRSVAGQRIAEHTRVFGIHRGALQVAVSSAALMGELASFHRDNLLNELQNKYPNLKIKDLKFRLRADLRDDA